MLRVYLQDYILHAQYNHSFQRNTTLIVVMKALRAES